MTETPIAESGTIRATNVSKFCGVRKFFDRGRHRLPAVAMIESLDAPQSHQDTKNWRHEELPLRVPFPPAFLAAVAFFCSIQSLNDRS